MEKIAEEQPERVVFVVLRGIETRFQFVEPEWKPEVGPEDQAAGNNGASGTDSDAASKEQD